MEAKQSLIFLPELDLAEAEQGDKEAQYRVGLYNREQKNYTEAVKWLQKAGNQNHAESLYTLAMMYETGEGIAQNTTEALKLYRKVAEQGYPEAKDKVKALHQLVNAKNSNRFFNSPVATSKPQEVIHINAKDAWFAATKKGDLDAMKLLLNQNLIGINVMNEDKAQAIHIAAGAGHTTIVEFLIDKGVSPSQLTAAENPFPPINFAVYGNHFEVVKLLLSKHVRVTDDSVILRANTPEMLELLISAGADIKGKVKLLNGPVFRGDMNFYNILLQKGLKPNFDTFYWALAANQFEMLKELSKIIGLTTKGTVSDTLLHTLAHMEQPSAKMVNFLIDAGIDVNALNVIGKTPLHQAVAWYYKRLTITDEMIKALLLRGANYTLKCNDGKTPFSIMCMSQEQFEDRYAEFIPSKFQASLTMPTHKPASKSKHKQPCLVM